MAWRDLGDLKPVKMYANAGLANESCKNHIYTTRGASHDSNEAADAAETVSDDRSGVVSVYEGSELRMKAKMSLLGSIIH